MKKLTLSLGLILLLSLGLSFGATAQAERTVNTDVTIVLLKPGTEEVLYTWSSGLETILITPSKNFLRTVSFTFDADHPVMDFSKPRRIFEVIMYYDINGDGIDEVIVDTMAVLTRSGNLKLVFHSNGAGNSLPPGWDF